MTGSLRDLWRQVSRRRTANDSAYRLLAENMGEVVCHIGDDGRFRFVSSSIEKVLGAPPEYWVGRPVREIIPPGQFANYRADARRLRAGEVVKDRVSLTAVDGTERWVHMFAKPFYDSSGRPDGTAVTFREIDDAEAKALQAASDARLEKERADERYRRSMESAAVGMALAAPDGRFEQVNNALCKFFGYDAATLTGKTWQELTVPEHVEADQKLFDDVLHGRRESYRTFKHYIHADGHRIWGDVSVSCVRDDQGRVENLIAQVIDVTEQVRAREQIAERDERNRVLAENLQRQTARLTKELESAAAYMSSILPGRLSGRVTVTSRYLPSRQLGGDSFNYTWIDHDHLMVYLIDVSGHGIRPALLSVSLHNVLRSGSVASSTLLDPEAVLNELNHRFQMEQQDDHYFTMWFGVYTASTRTLRYTSAGAPPALAFTVAPGGGVDTTRLSTDCPPVGMFVDTVYTSNSYDVPHGCRLLLYSDGTYEIDTRSGGQMELSQFIALSTRVATAPHWSLDDLVDQLRLSAPSGSFDDDCSLVKIDFD